MAEESLRGGLGRAIHLRRVELDLKRADVAKRASLSYPYISEIENGVKQPSVAALGRIAEALEMSVSELAGLSEEYAEEPSEREVWSRPASDDRRDAMSGSVPRRTTSRLLPQVSQAVATPPPPDELEELVRRVVREEMARWERDHLPDLVAREMRRRLDQAMGGDDR